MKYRWLGSSGLLVSRISLGTMTFGTDNWGCGEKESHAFRTQVDGPRFWNEQGFKTAAILEQVAQESGIPMATLAVAWPLRRKFVSSVTIGVRTVDQLSLSLEIGDWDMPQDVWNTLEERTRPPDEYTGWFAKANYKRFFGTAEFHDERAELP